MSKTILYRLFGIGRIPWKTRPVLESEGIIVSDEGVDGWYMTRKFKAPGKRFINRREDFLVKLQFRTEKAREYYAVMRTPVLQAGSAGNAGTPHR